ncbi:MAG: hypothetical protein ACKVH8_01295 [Pirellulales bacterium]
MRRRDLFLFNFIFLSSMLLATEVRGSDIRYVQRDGITYREIVDTYQKPVSETTYQNHTETFYQERVTTEVKESQRTYYAPVTEYQWEAYKPVSFNLFAPPRIAYRWVPKTRWEPRTETIRMPVTQREMVPQTRTVSRPVTTLRMVESERITRVAIADPPRNLNVVNGGTAIARKPIYQPTSVGGVTNLQNDPPRIGASIAPSRFQR